MLREIVFYGFCFPTLTLVFGVGLLLSWALERLLSSSGLYQWAWHPALLRFCFYTLISCTLSLLVYH